MPKVREAGRPPSPWASVGMTQPLVRSEGAQGLLDALALSTMPVPVVGDVAGLASDAYRFATDPSSRTWGNAAWASLGMLPFIPFAGIFAGKGAKTADAVKLAEAQKLEQAGAEARDIWSKTGWFKSPDGQWRFELTDDYSFLEHPEFAPKGYEKLQHPDVQDAYPEMWDRLQQSIRRADKPKGRLEDGNTIFAEGPTGEARRSVALHELQHAIQEREGFAPGASISASNFDEYRRAAGEAEARAVQARMNMTAAERAKSFPLDSYDVPPDQLIVRRR